jgi:hypothetical protein
VHECVWNRSTVLPQTFTCASSTLKISLMNCSLLLADIDLESLPLSLLVRRILRFMSLMNCSLLLADIDQELLPLSILRSSEQRSLVRSFYSYCATMNLTCASSTLKISLMSCSLSLADIDLESLPLSLLVHRILRSSEQYHSWTALYC